MSYFDDYECDFFYQQEKQIERIERNLFMSELTNVTTGKVRLSYVHLFKPHAFKPGQEEKYDCTVLVPKSDTDTMARINAAVEAAKQKGITEKWNGQCPPIIPTPINDGDGVRPSDGMPYGPECKGHWVLNPSAKVDYPPEVVDKMGNPIINQSQIYSGIYGRVNINFYPYAFGGKKGIGCGLGPVQKLEDGEPLSSSTVSAAKAFGTAPTGYMQPAAPAYQPTPGYAQPAAPVYQPAPAGYQQPVQGYAPATPAGAVNPITGLPY